MEALTEFGILPGCQTLDKLKFRMIRCAYAIALLRRGGALILINDMARFPRKAPVFVLGICP